MRLLIASVFLIVMTLPLAAQRDYAEERTHICDDYAPYYHRIDTGPGSILADLFFLPMSLPASIVAIKAAKRPKVTAYGETQFDGSPVCLPINIIRHMGGRPHVRHHR